MAFRAASKGSASSLSITPKTRVSKVFLCQPPVRKGSGRIAGPWQTEIS